ncbi:hypothetical protein TYRP_001405 [Tyrophagus putrescentiae]|nr:hypothetical protein TYRP_001405 [Tyrophagus putrescentiae]
MDSTVTRRMEMFRCSELCLKGSHRDGGAMPLDFTVEALKDSFAGGKRAAVGCDSSGEKLFISIFIVKELDMVVQVKWMNGRRKGMK